MNIWTKAGMSQQEYAKLPWNEKKRLLLRHGATFWLREGCKSCGKGLTPPRPFSGSFLLDAYFKQQAELKRGKV